MKHMAIKLLCRHVASVAVLAMLIGTVGCAPPLESVIPERGAVLDGDAYEQILDGLFPPASGVEDAFSEQYASRLLAEVELDDPPEAGSELVALLTVSCFGRNEYFFYPDGRMTVFVTDDAGVDVRVIPVGIDAIQSLQRDLEVLQFFNLSKNQANLKRFLIDHASVAQAGRLQPPRAPRSLEQETGVHYSLKAVHATRDVYHLMDVYELGDLKAQYPRIAEYRVFAECIRRVLALVPPDASFDLPAP